MTRVALVTGANRGIGRAVARGLAERGYTTILTARDENKAIETARELAADSGELVACQLDVTDPDSVQRLAARVAENHGQLDVLINNAGILYDTWQKPSTADLELVRQALEVNLLGAWRTTQALLALMRAGSKHGKRIVNVSSGAGSLSEMGAGVPAYGVSKAALNAVTIKLAAELHGTGVLVNAVCPGWVATDMGGSGGRPVEQGAASVLWAVDLRDDGPTGGFFRDGKPVAW